MTLHFQGSWQLLVHAYPCFCYWTGNLAPQPQILQWQRSVEAASSAAVPIVTGVLAGTRLSSHHQGGEQGGSETCLTWSVWFPGAARLWMTFWDEFSPPRGTLVEEALEKAAQSRVSVLAREAVHWLLERNMYFVSKILDIFALYANLWPLNRSTSHYRDKERRT